MNAAIHLLKVFIRKQLAFLFFIACFFVSNTVHANCQSSFLFKDSTGIDTMQKVNAASLPSDSSKIFGTLLSATSAVNKTFNFAMNADARYFVDDYIKKHTDYFNNMKIWGKPYFDLYDRILTSYGIPVQLKYLSVIESSLSCTAVSWAGAVGPWQIMSDAAREHGLKTNCHKDDRVDYIKSTNAACKILKELYETYGDWLVVIAAYNAGSGAVNKAIAVYSVDVYPLFRSKLSPLSEGVIL
jgi:membrane-bound lytic murein transglycosylase D